jgi:hypothetical protein
MTTRAVHVHIYYYLQMSTRLHAELWMVQT